MNYVAIALIALASVAVFYAVRFFRREGEKDRALLALFTPGNVVALNERQFHVLEIDLHFVLLQSVDEGSVHAIDLMTPAGTSRNELTKHWVRVVPS